MAEAATAPQRLTQLKRAVFLFGLMVLSACSTVVPRSGPPVERGPAVVAPPVAPPVVPGLPTDNEHHMVALLVPLTGNNAGVGKSIANATQLALLDTNNSSLRITTYDTATGAAAAAQRAIDEGARVIPGPCLPRTFARSVRSPCAPGFR